MVADQPLTLIQRPAACLIALTPDIRTHGYAASTGDVSVVTADLCPWGVVNTNTWIALVTPGAGIGSGAFTYRLDPNPVPLSRTGLVLVADQVLTLIQRPFACTLSLTPDFRLHGYGAAVGQMAVTAPDVCDWAATTSASWITLGTPSIGKGNGTLTYGLTANPSSIARTGLVSVADQVFTIAQKGVPCSFTLSPTDRTHGYAGTSGTISLTAPDGCAWSVVNTNDWVTINSEPVGIGNGNVAYTVAANATLNPRAGNLLIGDQLFALTQNALACSYKVSPLSRTHGFGASTNTITILAAANCTWAVSNSTPWITVLTTTTVISGGQGLGTVTYSIDANFGAATRIGVIQVGDQLVSLSQSPAPAGLTFDSITLTPDFKVLIRMSGGPGGVWVIQSSDDLTHWVEAGRVTNVTGRMEYQEAAPGGTRTARFYRAAQPQP